jgi:hypothetical protein
VRPSALAVLRLPDQQQRDRGQAASTKEPNPRTIVRNCSRCKPLPWPDRANPQPCNRGSINPDGATSITYGYDTIISGISGPLFSGPPSENTAFFTYRTDVLQATILPTNGDVGITPVRARHAQLLFQPGAGRRLEQPRHVLSGILIGRYQIAPQEFVELPTLTRCLAVASTEQD